MESASDRVRVAAALAGDAAALASLVDELTPLIQARVARRLLRWSGVAGGRDVRQEVEDLTQEVFLSLFSSDGRVLRSWDPERGLSLKNFVGLVAERQTVSLMRSGKRNPWRDDPTLTEELDGAAPAANPEEAAVSRETLLLLLERLRELLSPLGWQLFRLLYIEEGSPAEVGRSTGMSADAIYAWRSRLRRLARRILAELVSENGAGTRITV